MFKYAALLALGASGALAEAVETVDVSGVPVEVVRMSCNPNLPAAGFREPCMIRDANTLLTSIVPCADPNTVCLKKNFRFASCRDVVPDNWVDPRVIACDDAPVIEIPAVESPVVESPVVETPVVETPTVVTPRIVDGEIKDRDPEEGTNCLLSDLFVNGDPNGEQKCQCAGRLWRCADSKDPITKACDVGFQCIRKNAHYAICAAPDGERARKVKATCEWDMTPLPCGVHVGEYMPERLLPRGVCPP